MREELLRISNRLCGIVGEAPMDRAKLGGCIAELRALAEQCGEPVAYVKRESALAAISHVSLHNGPGRAAEAAAMLATAAPPSQPVALPDGWVAVPREPTEAMKVAALNDLDPLGKLVDWRGDECTTREIVRDCYATMLAAAPEVPRA